MRSLLWILLVVGCSLDRAPIRDRPGLDGGMRDGGGTEEDVPGLVFDVPLEEDAPPEEDAPVCPATCPLGEACPTASSACECDAAMCGPIGECSGSRCMACGHIGEPCCSSGRCAPGGTCGPSGCEPSGEMCGTPGTPCCDGVDCTGSRCIGGTCRMESGCGGDGEVCCAGGGCFTGFSCRVGLDGFEIRQRCRSCGGSREPCCPFGPPCTSGTCMSSFLGRYCG